MRSINWDYIGGFFDADGCVTIGKRNSTECKQMCLNFTNVELHILEEMKQFFIQHNINSHIQKCIKYKDHHLQSYELRVYAKAARDLSEILFPYIRNKKKIDRIKVYNNEYRPLIKRNGKYTEEERELIDSIAVKILEIK